MKQTISYDDEEIMAIKSECAEAIADFGMQFHIIQELYDALGLYYLEESNTNFRDSWFHYRKLYTQKDIITVLNEKYGLEEHLLRAAKDAQIYFLQQLTGWLEVWYRYNEYLKIPDIISKDDEEKLNMLSTEGNNWVYQLWKLYGVTDQELFSRLCLVYYKKNILCDDLCLKLQQLIHSMKNLILDLRLGGINIYRPANKIYYVKQCVDLYNAMCSSLKDTQILYLISATDTILQFYKKKSNL